MKLALIPPLCKLGVLDDRDYHLMLPHLVNNRSYYYKYEELIQQGTFIILDNGVAEGEQIPFEKILDLGKRLQVNEIVLPDVMGDAQATLRASQDALFAHGAEWPGRFMFVAQGQTLEEVAACVGEALQYYYVDTIGLPRHLLTTCGDDVAVRWELASYITSYYSKKMIGKDIHFLGMNYEYPYELELAKEYDVAKLVRGVDTSAPFNFAYNKGQSTLRPDGYFHKSAKHFDDNLIESYVKYLEEPLG